MGYRTERGDAIAKAIEEGFSYYEVAKAFNCSSQTVIYACRTRGVKSKLSATQSWQKREEIFLELVCPTCREVWQNRKPHVPAGTAYPEHKQRKPSSTNPLKPKRKKMLTTFSLITPEDHVHLLEEKLEENPGYDELNKLISPILKCGDHQFERVLVFWSIPAGTPGRYLDMFVDDTGRLKKLPFNQIATQIYLNNLKEHAPNQLKLHKRKDPRLGIYGPALLFHRKVWF